MSSADPTATAPSTAADVPRPVEVTGFPEGTAPLQSQPEASAGYEILGKLGEGAMGAVSLARDPVLRRTVALKSLLPRASRDGALLQRFVSEMQITAQLDHPHIVPVYGFDRKDASMSYAMKLVQGKELERLLRETSALVKSNAPLDEEHSLSTRLEIFVKVCDAVAYAHSRGVIHRDLKPANVMIGRFNEVYVVDWGVARQIGLAGSAQDRAAESVVEDPSALPSNQTRIGAVVGTPQYMSPEQAAAKNSELDGRSDLYALGLMLQEILTLEVAMAGATIQMALVSALQGKRNPIKASSGVPRELIAIVDRACQVRPEDRYASVAELAADVRRFMNGEEVRALPDSFPRKMGRWLSKHRMLAVGIVAGTFLLGVAAAAGVWGYNQVVLAEKRNREVRLVEVQADSSTRAQQLDATLVAYQESLQRLAGAAGIMLEKGDVAPLDLLTEERFAPGDAAVDGLVESAFYGKRVSFDWLVAARAPDADAAQTASSFGALQALGMTLPNTLIDSLGEDERRLSPTGQIELLAKAGAPVRRIVFTLEDGLSAAYPGMSGLAATTDGRSDSLYQRTKGERGVVWGPPTPSGETMLLTCATAIHSRDGRPFGVLHFEIDVGRAIAAALAADAEEVDVSLLVDRTGKVLAQNAKDPASKEPETISSEEVRAAIARGESGYLATKRDGRDVLVTYHPLASMDWYLVTVADVAKLETATPIAAAPSGRPASKPSAKEAPARPPAAASPPAPVRPVPTTSASAPASASASAASPSASTRGPVTPSTRPRSPFEPWPIYQSKSAKPQ